MASVSTVSDEGISILYEPDDKDDICVDIVFVHGLQGHPQQTWTKHVKFVPDSEEPTSYRSYNFGDVSKRLFGIPRRKNETLGNIDSDTDSTQSHTTSKSVFWPRDYLSEDCKNARIMTWGYDSKVTKFFGGAVNQNTFYEHAQNLLLNLKRKRTEALLRPLIFVAHSLGGIIVKQSLFTSYRDKDKKDIHDIYESTTALFFLGTPHRGSDYASWGRTLERIAKAALFDTNGQLIDHLAVNGTALDQLAKNFAALLVSQPFAIYSYQESRGYKGIQGLNDRVVDSWSSMIGNYSREQIETINANHMEMCRFESSKDPKYDQVGGEIKILVEKLSKVLQGKLRIEREVILNALSVIEVGGPHIAEPCDKTAVWLIDDPRFQSWLRNEHGLFWIKGKPGSGKSTLMKHIWMTLSSNPHLFDDCDIITSAFFFNARGTAQETALRSMLKVLLLQLIEKSDELYKLLRRRLRRYCKRKHVTSEETSNEKAENPVPLEEYIGVIPANEDKELIIDIEQLIKTQRIRKIVLFIDAVDEASKGDRYTLINLIEELAMISTPRQTAIDIIISSRPDTTIDINLGRDLSLEDENRADIVRYVEKELISRAKSAYGTSRHHKLGQEVLEKANGVFLWVCLVVPRLRACINRGDTFQRLFDILKDIPPGSKMEKLYQDVISRIDLNCLGESLCILQFATLSSRPLTIEELRHALGFSLGSTYQSLKDWESSNDYIEPGEQILQLIQSRTGGLLEVQKASSSRPSFTNRVQHRIEQPQHKDPSSALSSYPIREDLTARWKQYKESLPRQTSEDFGNVSQYSVRLIHETAKSFLLDAKGFSFIASIIENNPQECGVDIDKYRSHKGCFRVGGHDHIARMCLIYLTIVPPYKLYKWLSNDGLLLSRSMAYKNHVFLPYAAKHWIFHAAQAERGGLAQIYICQLILNSNPTLINELVLVAAVHGLISWLMWLRDKKGANFDTPSLGFGLPMQFAVKGRHIDAVKILLNGGAYVNGCMEGFSTTLAIAIANEDEEMTSLLYKYGATPSQVRMIVPENFHIHVVSRDYTEVSEILLGALL